jgi:class 3 adenylate cyclase
MGYEEFAPTGHGTHLTRTILFADLCGFTEYTCRVGDESAARLAVSFHHRSSALASAEGCEFVKAIGDGVMVESADCHAALRVACRIVALGCREGYPPIRAGLDTGPAVAREGDWYGSTVNTAARLAAAAGPGELVITERARQASTGDSPVTLVRPATWRLKGLPDLLVHAAIPLHPDALPA